MTPQETLAFLLFKNSSKYPHKAADAWKIARDGVQGQTFRADAATLIAGMADAGYVFTDQPKA